MKHDLAAAMSRATELVRAGNPAAATQLIQSSLNPGGTAPQHRPQPSLFAAFSQPEVGHPAKRSGLRDTLAALAKKMPAQARTGPQPAEPVLANGARFSQDTFSHAAGSREYRTYIPGKPQTPPAGMILMLHGCTQNPVDFANGTAMNRLAEAHGLIVVYPAQSRGANMQSCWNWFSPADQERDKGEPALLAGMVRHVQAEHGVPEGKVYVAGLSAGAAMAVILGRTHPDTFAAVGAHSGLAYKSARDVPSAFAAMAGNGAAGSPASGQSVPTIVFHGTSDSTVNVANGQRIADEARGKGTELLDEGTSNGRKYSRSTTLCAQGHAALEYWRVEGLGHAWSGGDAAGSYTDPTGPDASAEMVRFFLSVADRRS
ncbi:MAG: alpha/beta hydrolase family esterase [Rhodobacterales bacterium]